MDVVNLIIEHYKNNFDSLAKKAGGVLKDHALGQDATQEAYEAAYKYHKSFDPERGDFDRWITKIHWRAIGKVKSFSRGQNGVELLTEVEVNPGVAKSYLEDSDLSDSYKAILTQIYVNGYTPKELSKLMGEHSTSVIYKAIHLFKKEIKERNAVRMRLRGE